MALTAWGDQSGRLRSATFRPAAGIVIFGAMSESDLTPRPRRFSDKEVALVLRRASALQRSEPTAVDPEGLTQADLEEIAQEAGIDVEHIRQAVAELGADKYADLGTRLAGGPVHVHIERRLPGELTVEELEELVPLMGQATAGHGQASLVGKTLTWSSHTSGNVSSQQVVVSSVRGETLIRIEEHLGQLAGGLFGGIMGGVGGGVGLGVGGALGGALGSVFLGVGIPAVVIPASYFLARAIFSDQVRRRQRKLAALADTIEARLSERGALGAESDPPALPAE